MTICMAIRSATNEHGFCRYLLLDRFYGRLDDAHKRAKQFTLSAKPEAIYSTEEVLTEYMNYFAAWGSRFRRYATANVQNMRANQMVHIVPQTAASFEAGFTLYRAVC